ncbi:MAG: hypothetical protein U5S82_23145 [Gammaproteobacteria bacterium]|nr:hypothetical protein [Gammaproteobacteria bacterium]
MGTFSALRRVLAGTPAELTAQRLTAANSELLTARKIRDRAQSVHHQAVKDARDARAAATAAADRLGATPEDNANHRMLAEQADRLETAAQEAEAARDRAVAKLTDAARTFEHWQGEAETAESTVPTLADVKALQEKVAKTEAEAAAVLEHIEAVEERAAALAEQAPDLEELRSDVAELAAAEIMGAKAEGLAAARKKLATAEKDAGETTAAVADLELTLSGLRTRHAQAAEAAAQSRELLPGVVERALLALADQYHAKYLKAEAAAREAYAPLLGLDVALHQLGRVQSITRHGDHKPVASVDPNRPDPDLLSKGVKLVDAETAKAGVTLDGITQ